MDSRALYRRLLTYVRPHWRVFAVGILGMVIVAATTPALPALMKPLIEGTFIQKDPVLMQWLPVVIIVLFAVRGLGTYLAAYGLSWVGTRVVTDLRNAMFAKLLALPAAYYERQSSGVLISKLTFDVTQVSTRSEEHTSELQSQSNLVCRLLL